ncbi:MAG: hypothetical protein ABIO71_04285 [Caldimonas sp.]
MAPWMHPIIYVRGYAMSEGERDETAADPFCGVIRSRPGLSYAMTFGVKVPDYQVGRRFWADGHYEGRYLFQDTLLINMVPPARDGDDWKVQFAWQSEHSGPPTQEVPLSKLKNDKIEMLIPVETTTRQGGVATPGIQGNIRLIASAWNASV